MASVKISETDVGFVSLAAGWTVKYCRSMMGVKAKTRTCGSNVNLKGANVMISGYVDDNPDHAKMRND